MAEQDLREYLLWARANRFDVHEIEMGGVRMVLRDLGEVSPPAGPQPRSAHEAFAEKFKIPYREDDDDEEAMS